MDNEERAAFIRSMVDRLAARLADDPDDLDGWMRLGRAYRVLGDRDAALGAYGRSAELASVALPCGRPSTEPLEQLRTPAPSR